MSVNSGFRKDISVSQRLVDLISKSQDDIIEGMKSTDNISPVQYSDGLSGSSSFTGGGSGGGSASYLPTTGGLMTGAIAFQPKLTRIINGKIDISREHGVFSSRIIVSPENYVGDDTLNRIDNKVYNGQMLILQGILGNTITIAHDETGRGAGTRNIRTVDGESFKLKDNSIIFLIFDSVSNQWAMVSNTVAAVTTTTPEDGTDTGEGSAYGNADVLAYLNGLSEQAWQDITEFGDAVKLEIDSAYSWLSNISQETLNSISRWIDDTGSILDQFNEDVKSSIDSAYRWLSNVSSDIIEGWDTLTNWLTTNSNSFVEFAKTQLGDIYQTISGLSNKIATGISNFLGSTWTTIKSWFFDGNGNFRISIPFLNELNDTLENTYQTISGLSNKITTGISNFLGSTYNNLVAWYNNINADITDWFGDRVSFASKLVNEVGESIQRWINGIIIPGLTSNKIPITTNGNSRTGDIDMKTFDVTNVDRLFFATGSGVDGINTNESRPHISPVSGGVTSLSLYVPRFRTFHFYEGNNEIMNLSTLGVLSNKAITSTKLVRSNKKIRVGTDTLQNDGEISLDPNGNVIVRTGGKQKSMSDIGTGGGTPIPTHINQLIIENTSSFNTISAARLDELFGTQRGCLGIVCPATIANNSDAINLRLYVKARYDWHGIRFSRRKFSARSLPITAFAGSSVRRRAKFTQSIFNSPAVSLVGDVDGRIFVHQETDDSDDGTFGIIDSGRVEGVRFRSTTVREVNSSSISPDDTISLIDTIPVITIRDESLTASALNSAFGLAEGSIGFNKTENEFFIKINGYWWGLDLF